jgi:hypothetical protein
MTARSRQAKVVVPSGPSAEDAIAAIMGAGLVRLSTRNTRQNANSRAILPSSAPICLDLVASPRLTVGPAGQQPARVDAEEVTAP